MNKKLIILTFGILILSLTFISASQNKVLFGKNESNPSQEIKVLLSAEGKLKTDLNLVNISTGSISLNNSQIFDWSEIVNTPLFPGYFLLNGSSVMQGNPNIGGFNIFNITNITAKHLTLGDNGEFVTSNTGVFFQTNVDNNYKIELDTNNGSQGWSVVILSGTGRAEDNSSLGVGGNFQLEGGIGGADSNASTDSVGGIGGQFSITGGDGGAASSGTSTNVGGPGGAMTLDGGTGGQPQYLTGIGATGIGGDGGWVRLMGGIGRAAFAFTLPATIEDGDSGDGGRVDIFGGGSQAVDAGFTRGDGGDVNIKGGAGTIAGVINLQSETRLIDNLKLMLGTGQDASVYYNGTDMIINPKEVGSGKTFNLGDLVVTGNITGSSPVGMPDGINLFGADIFNALNVNATNGNFLNLFSNDWTNVSITESQISDLVHTSLTNVAFTNQTNIFQENQTFEKNISVQGFYVCPQKPAELGSELITEPSFASSSGWDLGTNWTISGGNANHTFGTSNLTSNATIDSGETYKLTYTIDDVQGSGNVTVCVGGVCDTTRTSAGSFEVASLTTTNTNNLTITGSGFGGELVNNTDFTSTLDPWSSTDFVWFHFTVFANWPDTGDDTLFQTIDITNGKQYQISIDVSLADGSTDGAFLSVYLGGTLAGTITNGETGVKTFNVTAGGNGKIEIEGLYTFGSDSDFYALDSVSVKEIAPLVSLSEISLKNITRNAGKICDFDGALYGTSFNVVSDSSLKSNIKEVDSSLSRKLYEYVLEGNEKRGLVLGLIAEELPEELTFDIMGILHVDVYALASRNYVDIGKLQDENIRIKTCAEDNLEYADYRNCIIGGVAPQL